MSNYTTNKSAGNPSEASNVDSLHSADLPKNNTSIDAHQYISPEYRYSSEADFRNDIQDKKASENARLLILENRRPLVEGENSGFEGNEVDSETAHKFTGANASRIERIKLLMIARKITDGHDVVGCLLFPTNLAEPVAVHYDAKRRQGRIRNVQTCKSVHVCPVCADRITRGRAAELLKGMETWTSAGNRMAMATYTLSHKGHESCRAVLDRLMAAYGRFKGDRLYKSRRNRWGVSGSVRVLEVTYGANGWHWHIHEIFFMVGKDRKRNKEMLQTLRGHWLHVVHAVGGKAVEKGFDLKSETKAAFDYVTKFGTGDKSGGWNMAREVTRAAAKIRSDNEGLHPFQILANADKKQAIGDRKAWAEYVKATHGVRQLVYSRGLKATLGIAEVTDAALVEADPLLPVLALITPRGWYRLNQYSREIVGEFYSVIDTGDAELLHEWLESNNIEMSVISANEPAL